MRVIAGSLKGRRLASPTWAGLRPTSDRLRETLFNLVGARANGAVVLDGYAGTGAVGIEALSRGAARVTFVDDDPRAIALIRRNLSSVTADAHAEVVRASLLRFTPRPPVRYDLVFLDPPYHEGELTPVLDRVAQWLTADGRVVVEHATRAPIPESGRLRLTRSIRSGDSTLSFFEPLDTVHPVASDFPHD